MAERHSGKPDEPLTSPIDRILRQTQDFQRWTYGSGPRSMGEGREKRSSQPVEKAIERACQTARPRATEGRVWNSGRLLLL